MGMTPTLTCVVPPPEEAESLAPDDEDPHPAAATTVANVTASPKTRLCIGPLLREQCVRQAHKVSCAEHDRPDARPPLAPRSRGGTAAVTEAAFPAYGIGGHATETLNFRFNGEG